MHSIEAAYHHQSHLKKQQDYGHQAVGVMLSCNELSLNYAIVLYDKSHSKIEIVQDIIQELPRLPHTAYFLCDSWYASNKLMDAFAQKGFQTIGALRTNRIIYPNQVKQQAKQFAPGICKNDPNVSLVTVSKRSYYVYRYQGKMNGHKDAVVLLSHPEKSFGEGEIWDGLLDCYNLFSGRCPSVFLSYNKKEKMIIYSLFDMYSQYWVSSIGSTYQVDSETVPNSV